MPFFFFMSGNSWLMPSSSSFVTAEDYGSTGLLA